MCRTGGPSQGLLACRQLAGVKSIMYGGGGMECRQGLPPMRGADSGVSVGRPGVVLYDAECHGYNWQWRENLGLLMTTDEAICTCTITATLLNTDYQMMLDWGWWLS